VPAVRDIPLHQSFRDIYAPCSAGCALLRFIQPAPVRTRLLSYTAETGTESEDSHQEGAQRPIAAGGAWGCRSRMTRSRACRGVLLRRSLAVRMRCQCKPLATGLCKFHGGKSTGPRTPEGRARIAEVQRRRWASWRGEKPAEGPG
jgi:hypothetical protein